LSKLLKRGFVDIKIEEDGIPLEVKKVIKEKEEITGKVKEVFKVINFKVKM